MADNGIFTDQAGMLRKAGANINSLLTAATDVTFVYSNAFIAEAESKINSETSYNWSDKYATLNVDVKAILSEAASNLSAMYVINYDTDSIGLKAAQSRLDVLYALFRDAIKILRDQPQAKFIKGA